MRGFLRNVPRQFILVPAGLIVLACGLPMIGQSNAASDGRVLSQAEMASIFGDDQGTPYLCLFAGKCSDTFPGLDAGGNVCECCKKADGSAPDPYNYCCKTQVQNNKLCTQTSTVACDPKVYFIWETGRYTTPQDSCGLCSAVGQLVNQNLACTLKNYTGPPACP